MEKASYEGVVKIRSSLEDLTARMLALKRDGQANVKGSLPMREIVTDASVLFIDLRRENREILQEEDKIKLETESAKAPIDHTTLQLHNLLYEKNHYVKAIKTCKDFRSKYSDIELVSEEAFFQDAPPELQSDSALRDDPHKLMIQRLKFELHQRKELLKQREIVETRKKLLLENIANRRKFLGGLASQLKTLKKATLPVQQQLNILHTKRSKQDSLAELLPAPLYIFYTELLSHKDVFGEAVELEIVGSGKDALTISKQLAMKEAGRKSAGSTGGRRDQEDDDDTQRQRKRAKKPHDKDAPEKDNVFQSHPLTVSVQIYDEKQKGSKLLTLKAEYLMALDVLCAGEESSPPAGVSPAFSLANLFPNDPGLELPTKSSRLRAGPGFVFDTKRTLRPYKWVQHLGGNDNLPVSPPILHGKESQTYRQQHPLQNVLQHLRARRKAQLALKDHLDSLGKLRRPSVKPDSSLSWTSNNPKATLQAWTPLDSKNGKFSSSVLSPTNGRPSSANTLQTENDTGKEDGELPSTGATDMDVAMTSAKPEVDTSEIRRDAAGGAEGMAVADGEDARSAADEGEIRQLDVEMGETAGEDQLVLPSLGIAPGSRTFRAVLRRENGTSGKRVEVEAQVVIGADYPTRAPEFRIRFLSGIPEKKQQPVSDGGGNSPVVQSDIRLMETEVNNVVPKKLPARERNNVLVHQILALMVLFDKF